MKLCSTSDWTLHGSHQRGGRAPFDFNPGSSCSESLEGSLRRDEDGQDKGVMNCSLEVSRLIYYSG